VDVGMGMDNLLSDVPPANLKYLLRYSAKKNENLPD
jgi:hypothetical protein